MAVMRALILIFLVFSVENAAAQDDCYHGWIPYGMKSYKFFSQSVDWVMAEKNCQSCNANLVSVHEIMENYFLSSLVSANTHVWIGGHDFEGQWLWADGSPFDFTNWCPTEPDNSGGKKNCLEINYNFDSCWNDDTCSNKKSYICVRPDYMQNKSV